MRGNDSAKPINLRVTLQHETPHRLCAASKVLRPPFSGGQGDHDVLNELINGAAPWCTVNTSWECTRTVLHCNLRIPVPLPVPRRGAADLFKITFFTEVLGGLKGFNSQHLAQVHATQSTRNGGLKRPQSISSAEGLHQHHTHPSALHMSEISIDRKRKKRVW